MYLFDYDKQGALACKANLHHPCICKNTPLHIVQGEDHPCVCSQGSHHLYIVKLIIMIVFVYQEDLKKRYTVNLINVNYIKLIT